MAYVILSWVGKKLAKKVQVTLYYQALPVYYLMPAQRLEATNRRPQRKVYTEAACCTVDSHPGHAGLNQAW
jgi:hypothetical protein